MDVLSTTDGSAQAVRDAAAAAAAASEAVDSRMALERELDRLNVAVGAHSTASAQHLQWTLLAQGFLLTSYLIVLVGGWSLPLPGKRWLLAAIAGYAAVSLVLGHLSQRSGRDRIAPLRQSRRLVEHALERIAARPIVFSRDGVIARSVGDWATTLTPIVVLAGWISLTLYTLSLPFPPDVRTAAEARGVTRAAAATMPTAPAPRGKGAPRKTEEAAPAPVAAETPAPEETGLAAMFRRAISPLAEATTSTATTESVKP
ncbi:MAG TPA: hypothetical protein VFN64_11795 [Burkholderiaceae bacterium]|nr:hypothetical protein [Burkholderiaceae bacterium]